MKQNVIKDTNSRILCPNYVEKAIFSTHLTMYSPTLNPLTTDPWPAPIPFSILSSLWINYGPLIFNKRGWSIKWSKNSLFNKWCWEIWAATCKKKKKKKNNPAVKWKGNQPYGNTYLQMIPQTRVWSPKYIKNSHNSTPGTQTIQ